MEPPAQIGWIGLGSMGSRMAPILVKNGYSVIGFDIDAERLTAVASHGIAAAPSLSALAANSDAIVSMIPSDQAFLDVVRGIRETAKPATCLIDMSTVSPDVSAQVAELLDAAGIAYLRAPVSGSTGLAAAGTLSILVSGPERTFQAWRPLIGMLGKKIAYLGPNEEARIMKLVVNVIVAAINSSLAEALNLGRRSGLDWNAMIDVINDSAVASPYIASKVGQAQGTGLVAGGDDRCYRQRYGPGAGAGKKTRRFPAAHGRCAPGSCGCRRPGARTTGHVLRSSVFRVNERRRENHAF